MEENTMFRITPLTWDNVKKMAEDCKQNIVYMSADLLEIQRGTVRIESSTRAIHYLHECANEWVDNLDASLYQRSVDSQPDFPPTYKPPATALEEYSWIMHRLYDVLEELKANPRFYNEDYLEIRETKIERIDKRYFPKSTKKMKRPPQYWCFSYNNEIHSQNEITETLNHSCYADDIWSVNVTSAYLQQEQSSGNLAYSTCGRLYFKNGATREKLKQIFPGAKLYMGKVASDFYKAYISEYYGPKYLPCVWHYHYYY